MHRPHQPPQADATAHHEPPVAGAPHRGPGRRDQLQMQIGSILHHMNTAVSQLITSPGSDAEVVGGIERTHAGLIEAGAELEGRVADMGGVQGEYEGLARAINQWQGDAELLIGAADSELKGSGAGGVKLAGLGQAEAAVAPAQDRMWMWIGAALLVAGGGSWWFLRQRRVTAAP